VLFSQKLFLPKALIMYYYRIEKFETTAYQSVGMAARRAIWLMVSDGASFHSPEQDYD